MTLILKSFTKYLIFQSKLSTCNSSSIRLAQWNHHHELGCTQHNGLLSIKISKKNRENGYACNLIKIVFQVMHAHKVLLKAIFIQCKKLCIKKITYKCNTTTKIMRQDILNDKKIQSSHNNLQFTPIIDINNFIIFTYEVGMQI